MTREGVPIEGVLASRQPIFTVGMEVLGYELLYRGNAGGAGDQVIGLEELVGTHLAFIHFDRKRIAGKHCESLAKDRVVLEIAETVEPDEELLQRLSELKACGYRISVDSSASFKHFHALMAVAHFVRFDVTGSDWPAIELSLAFIRKCPVQLIAERVETRGQFERCKAQGFDYFQGSFFCKPETIAGRRRPVNCVSLLRMLRTLNDPQATIDEVESAINCNVRLSSKLLRYANSAVVRLSKPVESIRHAIEVIGLGKIRLWSSLLLLYGFETKSQEIVVTGAVRARMCEKLAKALGYKDSDKLFLVGIFSILDGIVNHPIADPLESLPLSPAVLDAILYQSGELGTILKCVLAYERRDWVGAQTGINLPPEVIQQAYVDAVGWSLQTLKEFSNETENKISAQQ